MEQETKSEQAIADAKTNEDWLKKILHVLWTNKIVSGIVVSIILFIGGLAWKNIDPPFVKAQIEEIKTTITTHITSEDAKDSERDKDVAVLKNNVSNVVKSVEDITAEQKNQHDLLLQILFLNQKINTNTKNK